MTPEVESHLVTADCHENRTCVHIGEVETGLAELAKLMQDQVECTQIILLFLLFLLDVVVS